MLRAYADSDGAGVYLEPWIVIVAFDMYDHIATGYDGDTFETGEICC